MCQYTWLKDQLEAGILILLCPLDCGALVIYVNENSSLVFFHKLWVLWMNKRAFAIPTIGILPGLVSSLSNAAYIYTEMVSFSWVFSKTKLFLMHNNIWIQYLIV